MTAAPAARLAAQGIGGALVSPEAVVHRLLAVQAQDPRGFRLAVRARSVGLTAADVDSALVERRTLVVGWLHRGTLHLVGTDDYWWQHALTGQIPVTASFRRLEQEGVDARDAERGIEAITSALASQGPLLRVELRDHVAAAGVRAQGQALPHLLVLASSRGLVVRGPLVGREQAFALTADWLGPAPDVDRDEALAALAVRYLAAHHPATERDLAVWSGLPLRDVRRGIAAAGAAVTRDADGSLRPQGEPDVTAALPPPTLLGPFDPVLHGWADRSWVLGDHAGLVTSNGIFKAAVLVEGRAVGTWRTPRGQVELEPFEPIAAAAGVALAAEAADVRRFLATAAEQGATVPP